MPKFRYVKRHKRSRLPVHVFGFSDLKSAVIGIPTVLAIFFTLLATTGNVTATIIVTLITWLILAIVLGRKNRNVKIYKAKKNFKIEIVKPEEE